MYRRFSLPLLFIVLGCLGGCFTTGSLLWDVEVDDPTGNVDDSSVSPDNGD